MKKCASPLSVALGENTRGSQAGEASPQLHQAKKSVAAKEAHANSLSYAQERMASLYGEIGLPTPPPQ